MICKNCGNKVNDYDKFCTSCGEYVDKNIEDKINTNKNNRKVKILISVTLLIGLVCIGLYTVLKNKLENTEYISSEYTYFESGLAVVGKIDENKNAKYGYVDKTGNLVIDYKFNDAQDFGEGLAAVKISDKWGYIDKKGNIVIDTIFDDAKQFNEGLASVKVGDKWGYIDKKGDIIINPQFTYATEFKEDRAVVNLNGKYGQIDKKGNIVINPQFDTMNEYKKINEEGVEEEILEQPIEIDPGVEEMHEESTEIDTDVEDTRTVEDVMREYGVPSIND